MVLAPPQIKLVEAVCVPASDWHVKIKVTRVNLGSLIISNVYQLLLVSQLIVVGILVEPDGPLVLNENTVSPFS